MTENFRQQLQILPENLGGHLRITVIPLMIGLAISFPLAVLIVRRPRLRYPTLTAASIVQTIPSLALLALMVPVLAGISALLKPALGIEIEALGFWPAVIALTLYSMLPILRNTVTGIHGVEPAMIEAARGVGMTEPQVLWRVQLPLAAPVIIAGIRTATVWVVGIATLATPVGQRCLGNYIFLGLQTRNWTAVLFGCIAAASLAIVLDLLIGGLEKATRQRRRRLGFMCGALLIALVVSGLIAAPLMRWRRAATSAGSERPVWVGAKTFTEQYILADLIGEMLADAGFSARQRESLGSTVVFDALVNNEIDCYVDYSGTIWANHMGREAAPDAEHVLREMTGWLHENHGIRCLGSLGFENAYGLAMRRDQAVQLGIETIADLREHAPQMTIGGDYEFFGRPEWKQIRDAYGITFADSISYDSTFMYTAVANGTVDVISAFTSDGRIAAFDLLVLDDPKNAIPPYDAVLLLSPEAGERPGIDEALAPLVGSVPVETMREANYMVDREDDRRTIADAARWLRRQILPAVEN